ncbi:YdhR family protein [Nakamurella sp. PAMC28650]|uniref:YdhR family protein n=1 Tax=Nakamurella sp. PAMC28650 TaxID=2762325 RepID=UPI00164E0E1D|nr:YdhR family protein [Nakamurella sp. PAMC28650]QNK82888.1 YdhR family protein [Nakamurella sp. PAMC28650]
MPLQIITFELDGIDDAAYRAHADQQAPVFAAVPGLRAKIWLADEQRNVYGGIYTWDDSAAMRAHRAGAIFQQLLADPHLTGVAVSEFSVLAGLTTVTGGQF